MPRRLLLKLSGESFCKEGYHGIDPNEMATLASILKEVHELGTQVAVVVGGGNIIRGASLSKQGVGRITADYMGMMGTLINALALQDALEKIEVPTRVQTAINTQSVAEPYIRRRCIRHLEKGRLVILAGGGGVPLFTTDTTAILRAKEIEADIVLKATKVDGVYSCDPKKHSDAVRYDRISYEQVIREGLEVMDATAITLAKEHAIPIMVFNVKASGNVVRAVKGEVVGTLIE